MHCDKIIYNFFGINSSANVATGERRCVSHEPSA